LYCDKRISLVFTKLYLDYLLITLLKQRINNLDILILIKKIATISSLQFLYILRKLKRFLELIKYLRSSILYYAQRALSLQQRKTTLIQNLLSILIKNVVLTNSF
jgi:hypothetical protein